MATIAFAVVGLLAAPAIANAAWLPAADVSAENDEFAFEQEPQIAIGGPGNAVAVWPQLHGHYIAQASSMLPGGGWGPAVDISPPGQEAREPRVAINAAGEAVAVWNHLHSQSTVSVASRTPQGTWGPAREISTEGGDPRDFDVAIDPAGNAVVVWTQYNINESADYRIHAATRSPAGEWSQPVFLSETGNNAWAPKLAVEPSGHVVAAWSHWDDNSDVIVQVAEMNPGGSWSEPVDISPAGVKSFYVQVAASAGRTVVVWAHDEVVESATRDAGGPWQEAVELSWPESAQPALGIDSKGNALAVWSSGPLAQRTVEAAALPVGGAWTEPILFSDDHVANPANPQVAIDPAGRAMVVWTSWAKEERLIKAAAGSVDGALGSPVVISAPDAWAVTPQIATDDAGDAAAVWRAAEPGTMQAAVFDVTRPQLRSVSIPSPVRAGRPISFSASPFDAWSPVNPLIWSFGDGSGATGQSAVHPFPRAGRFQVTVTATDAAGNATSSSGLVDVTPALAAAARVVTVRNGKARLQLNCPGTAVCRGGASLIRKLHRKGRPRSIGASTLAIPGETEKTVIAELDPKVLKLLAAAPRHRLRARLGGDAVEPRTVVLESAAPRRNHQR